jgi:hypothetical protein
VEYQLHVKLLFLLALVLLTPTFLPQGQAQIADHVIINEVELNPAGDDTGKEWVELYNPTPTMIDLTGWTLQTTHGVTVTVTIPQGAQIAPNGYYIVTNAGQWLDNQNESIILRDKSGQQKDLTSVLSDTANDDYTWQRNPDGSDNWVFKPSTRGVINIAEMPTPILVAAAVIVASVFLLRRRRM